MSENSQPNSLYDIIGCAPNASADEIKRAYRRKALELHPDRNQDDPLATEKFQQLGDAYEILKDPSKRERYDRFGISGDQPTEPEDIEMFEMMTQVLGLGRKRGPPTGRKVSTSIRILHVPLENAFKGGEFSQEISYHQVCPLCHGIGSNNGIEYPMCQTCHGAGSMSPGGLQFLFPCNDCKNVGYIMPIEARCSKCNGRKIITSKKIVTVTLEQGVDNEERFMKPEEGDEFPGKETADLLLVVMMKWHSKYVRRGDDLYYTKSLSIYEAKKGTAFSLYTLDGKCYECCTEKGKPVDMSVIKWIPNEGMPCRGNLQFRGNIYIIFEKGFPEPITESIRTVRSFFNRLNANVLLQDAPKEIQEQYKRQMEEEAQLREEARRQLFNKE